MAKRTTKNEFRKSMSSVLEAMETKATGCGIAGREERRKKNKDFWHFFNHYLPHYGSEKSPAFHREIIKLLDNNFVAIAAPRGFAKSTLVSFAYVLWQIATERSRFIVIVSASDDLAKDLSGFIRLELTDNKRLREDYGILLVEQGAEGDFVAGKTRVLARGRKQAVRGFRYRESRPDLIILDDIEKDEEALNPKTVLKTLETIKRGLIPSLKPGGRFVLVGTILQTRSVAGTILLSEDEPWNLWTRKIYHALIGTGEGGEASLWEERFPAEYLKEIRDTLGRTAFNAEFQNMPTDDDTALFTLDMLRDGSYPSNAPMAMFIDPSVDGIKKNDYKTAVLVAATAEGFVAVDAVMVQGRDVKFFDETLSLYKKHSANILTVTVECIAFMAYFVRDLEQYARERGVKLPLTTTSSNMRKEHRIAQLAALFETGRIGFDAEFRKSPAGKILIDQLLYFPSVNVHDDGPDALAGAVKVLEARTSKTAPLRFLPGPKPGAKSGKMPFWRKKPF